MAFTLYKELKYALDGIPTANLTDFPKRFKITGDADIAAECALGGGFKVTSADGLTDLPIEVLDAETDLASGDVEFWVKVDLLTAASVGDVIARLYYDGGETTVEDHANTWSGGYGLVLHLEQDPSGAAPQMYDSVSGTNIGTTQGSMTSGDLVATQIGNGLDFDGSDDAVSIPAANLALLGGSFTLRIIFNANPIGGGLLSQSNGSDSGTYDLTFDLGAYSSNKNGHFADFIGAPVANQWNEIVVRNEFNVGTDLYENGVFIGSGSFSNGVFSTPTLAKLLGGWKGGANPWYAGRISELSLEVLRSVEWIEYQYADDFANADTFTLGPEEGGTPPTTNRRRRLICGAAA
jgi:hypothetical protein